jgi:hypothetical protein
MDWLRKYKFKNGNVLGWVSNMNYLCGKNLSDFEYLHEISEEEFLIGNRLRNRLRLRLKLKD